MIGGELIDYAKANPYVAGGVGLASFGAVAVGWFKSRGNPAPARSAQGLIGDSTTPGAIVQIRNEVLPTPAPLPTPGASTVPPTGVKLGGQPAPIPAGYECPNGTTPRYGVRAGTFQQTDGNVVCMYPDGRSRPAKKKGVSWSDWRRGK